MDDRELDRRISELYQFCEDNQFLLTIICKKLEIDIDKEIEKQQINNNENEEEEIENEEYENDDLLDERELAKKEKTEQQQKYDIQIQKPYKKQ